MPFVKIRRTEIERRKPYETVTYVRRGPRYSSGGRYGGYARKLSNYLHNQQRFYSGRAYAYRIGMGRYWSQLNHRNANRRYFAGVRNMAPLRNYLGRYNPGGARAAGVANGGIGSTGSRVLGIPRPVRRHASQPHAWQVALTNPWDPRLSADGMQPRIPDGTMQRTLVMQQNASAIWNLVSTVTSNNSPVGAALRPSMADGTQVATQPVWAGTLASETIECDAFLYARPLGGGTISWTYAAPEWFQGGQAGQDAGYYWGGSQNPTPTSPVVNPQTVGSGGALNWTGAIASYLGGPEGVFAHTAQTITRGNRARPTAWGFRITYAGITSPGATNMVPAGYIYWGTRTSQHSHDNTLQQEAGGVHPRQTLDSENFFDTGPANPISIATLDYKAANGTAGRMSFADFAKCEQGIIVACGPVGSEETDFKDIDYATGINRWAMSTRLQQDTTAARWSWGANGIPFAENYYYNPGCFDMIGSNPWFLIIGMEGVQVKVEAKIFWEVIPSETALAEIPQGAIRQTGGNPDVMAQANSWLAVLRANPARAQEIISATATALGKYALDKAGGAARGAMSAAARYAGDAVLDYLNSYATNYQRFRTDK